MEIDEKYLALQEFLRDREFKNQEEKDKTLMAFETMPEEQKEELLEQAKMRLKGERACKNLIKKYEKKLNEFKYFFDPEYYDEDKPHSTDIDGNPIVEYPFTYQGNSIKLQDSVIRILYDYKKDRVRILVEFAPQTERENDFGLGVEDASIGEVLKLLECIHENSTKPLKYCINAVFS